MQCSNQHQFADRDAPGNGVPRRQLNTNTLPRTAIHPSHLVPIAPGFEEGSETVKQSDVQSGPKGNTRPRVEEAVKKKVS